MNREQGWKNASEQGPKGENVEGAGREAGGGDSPVEIRKKRSLPETKKKTGKD